MDISKTKVGVQLLWMQGMKDEARKLELNARLKGHNIGSCETEEWLDKFITEDEDMLKLKDDVRIIQQIMDPILIQGETGTGKEIIARALHGSRGPMKEGAVEIGRFVDINCPALSVDLMESELFGHVKGAFTGAVADKIGAFQYAFKGTLFIDEIGDMPPSMQAAILRVLQEKVIKKVGDNERIPVDFRLVCATNKNLEEMVVNGSFRLDLYHRLNTFVLRTKPLCVRQVDIALMIKEWDKSGKFIIEQTDRLPGNVRELQARIRKWNVLGRL